LCSRSGRRLLAANVLASLATGFATVLCVLLYVPFRRWHFLALAVVNACFAVICAHAVRQIYGPEYKLRRMIHDILREDFDDF